MEFYADETIPVPSVEEIRALGNTVEIVRAESPDERSELVRRAIRDGRILLTFKLSYYELIFDANATPPPGVVCFRLDWETPREPANVLAAVLTDDELAVAGQFTVLEGERMRQRPLEREPE